jgi:hypothetical protein
MIGKNKAVSYHDFAVTTSMRMLSGGLFGKAGSMRFWGRREQSVCIVIYT